MHQTLCLASETQQWIVCPSITLTSSGHLPRRLTESPYPFLTGRGGELSQHERTTVSFLGKEKPQQGMKRLLSKLNQTMDIANKQSLSGGEGEHSHEIRCAFTWLWFQFKSWLYINIISQHSENLAPVKTCFPFSLSPLSFLPDPPCPCFQNLFSRLQRTLPCSHGLDSRLCHWLTIPRTVPLIFHLRDGYDYTRKSCLWKF